MATETENTALFRDEALEAAESRRKLEAVSLSQPLSVFIFAGFIGCLVLMATTFAIFVEYPRRVEARGYLTTEGALSYVYATRDGFVTHSLVVEGSRVEPDSPLVELAFPSELAGGIDLNEVVARELDRRLWELKKQKTEIDSQYDRLESVLTAGILRTEEQVSAIENVEQLKRRQLTIALSRQEAAQKAFTRHAISRQALHEQQSRVLEAQVALTNAEQRRLSLSTQIIEYKRDRERLRLELSNTKRTLEIALSEIRERLAKSKFDQASTVHAPVGGIVSAMQFREGESVRAGDVLMAIAPEESFMGMLHLPNRSAALLDEGREIQLLFDAFPPAKYGVLSGTLGTIASIPIGPEHLEGPLVANEPMYVAHVKLRLPELGQTTHFRLLPGMSFTAHISLERRTLAEWILEPVLDVIVTQP